MARSAIPGVMTSGLLAVLLAGCGGEPETVTSSRTKYQVAEERPDSSRDTRTASSPSTTTVAPPVDEISGVAKTAESSSRGGSTSTDQAIPPAPERPQPSAPGEDTTASRAKPAEERPPVADPHMANLGAPPSAPGANPYAIRETAPEQILAALRGLAGQRPTGATRAAALADFQNVQDAMIQGAEKLMTMKTDGKTQQMAAEIKVLALTTLAKLGDREAPERINAFCKELLKNPMPELAKLGQRLDFANTLETFASNPSGDSQKLLREFEKWFADEEKDARTLEFGSQVVGILEQTDHRKEALAVLKSLADAYEKADPSLAEAVGLVKERLRITEEDLNGKMDAVASGKPDAVKPFLDAVLKVLEGPPLGEMTLNVVRSMTQQIEGTQPDAAKQIYQRLSEAYATHSNPDLAKQTKEALGLFERRNALVGQPFSVEGVTLQGTPLDAAKYQGKVVLVDFWATWCGPCLQEIPNLRKLYDLYRDQGFEIVGVNLDDDLQQLRQFASLQPLPWATVIGGEENARGASHPLAVKCGVEAIPFFILIDRSGKAAAVNPSRQSLDQKIQELLKAPAAKT